MLDRVLELEPEFLQSDGTEHVHDSTILSVSCRFEGKLNMFKLQRWICKLIGNPEDAVNLFPYKGVLAVKGKPEKFVFQGVHMTFAGGFSDTHRLEDGGEGESSKRECVFVFIGKNLDEEKLLVGFMECKAEDTLQFDVGDAVQAGSRTG